MAGICDFTGDDAIEQGATLSIPIDWEDDAGTARDITGYTARMEVRKSVKDTTVLLTLTTENNGITIDGPAGRITLTQTAVQTAAYDWKKGVYDLELVSPGGVVTRLIQGDIEVSPEVTR